MAPSLFLNATVCPEPAGAGFGENAPLPAELTIATVTFALVAAGAGVVGDDGVVGVE